MNSPKDLEHKIRRKKPLIIIGMHRSGTSLTVRLLHDLGIHLGSHLSRDAEAVHFQTINRMIYHSAGSNWGVVDSLLKAMESENFIEKQAKRACKILFPGRRIFTFNQDIADFFGKDRWEMICRGEEVWWGWKDPRTSLTFPIWMKVFPEARVLNILRNGIDVAISIHRRSLKQRQKIWKRMFPIDYIPETLDFNYCFDLWEKHIAYIDNNKALVAPERYLELRYEDLLANPYENLRKITAFWGYPLAEGLLESACSQVNKERLVNTAYARPYQEKIASLVNSPWMEKLNYSYQVAPGQ